MGSIPSPEVHQLQRHWLARILQMLAVWRRWRYGELKTVCSPSSPQTLAMPTRKPGKQRAPRAGRMEPSVKHKRPAMDRAQTPSPRVTRLISAFRFPLSQFQLFSKYQGRSPTSLRMRGWMRLVFPPSSVSSPPDSPGGLHGLNQPIRNFRHRLPTTMKTPAILTRRRFIALITILLSTGLAVAGVCQRCGGSGTGAYTCNDCKGSGKHGSMKCTTCKGTGFMKCPNCRGTGQTP